MLGHAGDEELGEVAGDVELVHVLLPGRAAHEVVGREVAEGAEDLDEEVVGVGLRREAEDRRDVAAPEAALEVLDGRVLAVLLVVEGPGAEVADDLHEEGVARPLDAGDEGREALVGAHELRVVLVEAEVPRERRELARDLAVRGELDDELHDDGDGLRVGEHALAAVVDGEVVQDAEADLAELVVLLEEPHELGDERGPDHLVADAGVEAEVEEEAEHGDDELGGRAGHEAREARDEVRAVHRLRGTRAIRRRADAGGCSARARPRRKDIDASRPLRAMIARRNVSRNDRDRSLFLKSARLVPPRASRPCSPRRASAS